MPAAPPPLPAGYVERRVAGSGSVMARKLASLGSVALPSAPFGADIKPHACGLERAAAAAAAAAAAGAAEPRRAASGRAPRHAVAAAGGLADGLKTHKCGLEKAKEAALAAAAAAAESAGGPSVEAVASPAKRRLSDAPSGLGEGVKVHKSGLERAKKAAAGGGGGERPLSAAAAKAAAREAAQWAQWGGEPLGASQRHMSKLEKEAAAWKEAAAKRR